MKATERRLMDIIGDIYYDAYGAEGLSDFEIVIDQVVKCMLPDCDLKQPELTELCTTTLPVIAEVVVLGGKPKNRYEITILPVRDDDAA